MTDEEIKKLAESYVDELFAFDDMSDQETIEAKKKRCIGDVYGFCQTHFLKKTLHRAKKQR